MGPLGTGRVSEVAGAEGRGSRGGGRASLSFHSHNAAHSGKD